MQGRLRVKKSIGWALGEREVPSARFVTMGTLASQTEIGPSRSKKVHVNKRGSYATTRK